MKTARPLAEVFITHFYEALQNAIRRGLFLSSVRTLYGLAANEGTLPSIKTEADVTFWGGKAATGETNRLLMPGAVPITFPSIAEVNTAVGNFNTLNLAQAEAKTAYDNGQEAIEEDADDADELILRMWNETEAEFDKGDKPSMRRKSREWGVIYAPTPGETPSPDEFSIMGKVTDSITGNPIADAELVVGETGDTYASENNGDYFVSLLPPGIYDLTIVKVGYVPTGVDDIAVTAGVITTQNITLVPLSATGTVTGNVKKAGANVQGAQVSVIGLPTGSAVTDIDGNFTLSNIPAGAQQVRVELPPAFPDAPQTQNVTVVAGSGVVSDFNF